MSLKNNSSYLGPQVDKLRSTNETPSRASYQSIWKDLIWAEGILADPTGFPSKKRKDQNSHKKHNQEEWGKGQQYGFGIWRQKKTSISQGRLCTEHV